VLHELGNNFISYSCLGAQKTNAITNFRKWKQNKLLTCKNKPRSPNYFWRNNILLLHAVFSCNIFIYCYAINDYSFIPSNYSSLSYIVLWVITDSFLITFTTAFIFSLLLILFFFMWALWKNTNLGIIICHDSSV